MSFISPHPYVSREGEAVFKKKKKKKWGGVVVVEGGGGRGRVGRGRQNRWWNIPLRHTTTEKHTYET